MSSLAFQISALKPGLRRSAWLWLGLAALATLPTEILSMVMNWDMMNPAGYVAEALWFPVFSLCQLALLRSLGQALNSQAGHPPIAGRPLASLLAAEILLGLKFSVVLLVWALPALIFISVFGLEALWSRVALALIALLCAVAPITWILRRLFAPAVIVWQGLKASEAISESARLSQGKLRQALWPLLLLNGIALILEGLSGVLDGGGLLALPLSFLFSNIAIAIAYRILTL